MAKGPNELRGPNALDLEVIRALEESIDKSSEFSSFRGGTVRVDIHPTYMRMFLREHPDVRKEEIIKRYQKAGWFSVKFLMDAVEFSEVDISAGRE